MSRVLNVKRRAVLGGMCALMMTPISRAAAWFSRPRVGFAEADADDTIAELFPHTEIVDSDNIRIAAADLAENGAVVPIKVEVELEEVRSISLLATKNPVPLIATFMFAANAKAFVATRVKLAESSEVVAIVETANGVYRAAKAIEVTIGGCGV